jgi:hypothetical protein
MRCSVCKSARYCGADCQRQDRAVHKALCRAPAGSLPTPKSEVKPGSLGSLLAAPARSSQVRCPVCMSSRCGDTCNFLNTDDDGSDSLAGSEEDDYGHLLPSPSLLPFSPLPRYPREGKGADQLHRCSHCRKPGRVECRDCGMRHYCSLRCRTEHPCEPDNLQWY